MKPILFVMAFLVCACSGSKGGDVGSGNQPLSSPTKFDGASNGCGGKGVKCGRRVTTLDLWEAVHVHGLKLQPLLKSLDEEIVRGAFAYVKQTQPRWSDPMPESEILREMKKSFFDIQVFIPAGQRLAFTQDATLPALPVGCEIVQIAIYENGKISTDREYWNLLNDQAKSALIFHELAYFVARQEGHGKPLKIKSDEVRVVIGKVFSTRPIEPNFPDVRGKSYAWCGAGGGDNKSEIFEVYFVEETRGGVAGLRAYFFALKGEYMLTQTVSFLPGIVAKDLVGPNFPKMQVEIRNAYRGTTLNFELGTHPLGGRDHIFIRAWNLGEKPPVESWAMCSLKTG